MHYFYSKIKWDYHGNAYSPVLKMGEVQEETENKKVRAKGNGPNGAAGNYIYAIGLYWGWQVSFTTLH